jgi:hypothetical protein
VNWFWLNIPPAAVFFLATGGIPLWLTIRHGYAGPVTDRQPSPAAAGQPETRQPELAGASR